LAAGGRFFRWIRRLIVTSSNFLKGGAVNTYTLEQSGKPYLLAFLCCFVAHHASLPSRASANELSFFVRSVIGTVAWSGSA
jgi:hypothetical protein